MNAREFAALISKRTGRVATAQSNGEWRVECPGHADSTPSLFFKDGRRGLLIHCFAGCSPEHICDQLGISLRDLRHRS
jgi:hypothetical protein